MTHSQIVLIRIIRQPESRESVNLVSTCNIVLLIDNAYKVIAPLSIFNLPPASNVTVVASSVNRVEPKLGQHTTIDHK